ncbi:hypothetical protein [uncultured Polaribacter sp.]|uniref:hypothetical protein n=1 Tax=uncultured Polaribacter sp. TaxID=174711 RepID=UPI00262580B9|nr:hypothetical protein [uncultured Polaribacter sp.]
MKKVLVINFILLSLICSAQDQNISVERSVFSVQIGTVGVWLNNEIKMLDNLSLRTEVGLYTEIVEGNGFFMAPEITLEPRWYYNLGKRNKKGRNIANNAANFFTIKTSYRSNIFEILHDRGKGAENSISFIPKWGIRRNLGKYFNYEAGIGIGYLTFFDQKYFTAFDSDGIIIDLHLRIGINL